MTREDRSALTRRRAGELAEEFLAEVWAMEREEVMRRWSLPEHGGTGPDVAQLYDAASGAFYVRAVTASLTRSDTVVVVGVLPPNRDDSRAPPWLPLRVRYVLDLGPRWARPVSRNVVLS